MMRTFNPSTQQAEAGRYLVGGQPGLQSEFLDSLATQRNPVWERQGSKRTNKLADRFPYWDFLACILGVRNDSEIVI